MVDNASKTAEYMALFRAMEACYPSERRLFEDPFARSFLSVSLKIVSYIHCIPLIGAIVPWIIDKQWAGARASGIARTRLIDYLLIKALHEGIEQVVVLGAGYDCRAYRIPEIAGKKIFEVDHPHTLKVKRNLIHKILGEIPSHVVFAEIDFNKQKLEDILDLAGFDTTRRTFFIWEGVTNYLTGQAVDATLRFVSSSAPGSYILFTYIHKGVIDAPEEFFKTKNLAKTLKKVGEPWTFGLKPDELPEYLKTRGLQLIDDIGSVEYRSRYMNRNGSHMKGYEFYRAALAKVGESDV